MNMKLRNLSELQPGMKAIIDSFADEELSIRLLEMGCLPGEEVEIAHIAPLGDPIAIHLYGHKLSLRKKEAESILVK
jgi:ferrous iron transport protein A